MVTKRKPSKKELEELLFAWKAVKHIKSNAIVLTKDKQTVGIGAGQMSRIDEAVKAGIIAIIQPGGSKRDEEVIEVANEHNLAMVFTGIRCFKH